MGDVSAGLGCRERVAHLGLVVQPGGEEAALFELDGDAVFALKRLLGTGGEGVGSPRDGTRELGADVDVAARLEGGELGRAAVLVGDEDEALGVVRLVNDLGYLEVLRRGVQPLGQLVHAVGAGQGLCLGGGYHLRAVLAEVFELQHVEYADKSDLDIHITQPPSSYP